MKELRRNRDCIYTEKPPFPRNMIMELTNACNHACIFCANKKQRRKISVCNKELFMKLIQEAYENGTREIGFYLGGEPFMHPQLESFVKKAGDIYNNGKERFEYIYITTNGALADIERIKKMVFYGLSSIKFSVNAATRDIYQRIHGKDDFEKVKKNIRNLSLWKTENNIDMPIFISFIRNKHNYFQVDLMQEIFGKYVDKIYFCDVSNQGGNMYENNGIRMDNAQLISHLPCEQMYNRLHINSDGFLEACCVDFDNLLAIADLRKMSLREAWHDEKFIDLRRQNLTGDMLNNQCYNCVHNTVIKNLQPINKELYHL